MVTKKQKINLFATKFRYVYVTGLLLTKDFFEDYKMSNTLKVIKPFSFLEKGDVLELNENGMYQSVYRSEYSTSDENCDNAASFTSIFEISKETAESLIRGGFLSQESEKGNFVNIFDQIDALIDSYTYELNTIDESMKDSPACMKVEKETVLRNMSKLLDHLKSLKK